MPINQAILQDKNADSDLLNNGYAVISFLNDSEVAELKAFFQSHHQEVPKGLYASAHNPDIPYRNKMNNKIKEVFERANVANFTNHQALGGTFMVKSPGEEGSLYPHKDWNIVDEDEWRSFNVWVPLVDVDSENGSIQVLPKSHLGEKTYRGINIPPSWNTDPSLWETFETLEMKAGEALIYDHRLLHASKENKSNNNRLVVVYGIIPKEAEMRYYYLKDDGIVEYECYPDFFLKGNPFEGPKGLTALKTIKIHKEKILTPKKSIFGMIKDLFN